MHDIAVKEVEFLFIDTYIKGKTTVKEAHTLLQPWKKSS